MSTILVRDLDDNKAVMYRGTIYRIERMSTEGSLKSLKLVSLNLQDIVTVLWHPSCIVTSSPVSSKRCLILKENDDNKFEIEGIRKKLELNLPKDYAIKARKWLAEEKIVVIVLHHCFNDMHFGNIYSFN